MGKSWIGTMVVLGLALAAPATFGQTTDAVETKPLTTGATASEGEFNRDLLTIEEEVNGLKERVFRAKATLQLLSEVVAQGSAAGSKASVVHVNQLGRRYAIQSIAYYVNGQGAFSKTASDTAAEGTLDSKTEFKVFEGSLPPGTHTVAVNLRMRGNGWGVFSYVDDYEFGLQSTQQFTAEEGKVCQVKVVIDERKGAGLSFSERPGVTYETRCVRMDEAAASFGE
jgi:hypothetical protein